MDKRLASPFSRGAALFVFLLTLLVEVLFVAGVPLFQLFELKTYDLRFRSRPPRRPIPQIVLAVVDEKSLDAEGRWPWPRTKIARLLEILSEEGAKVVGFDMSFTEPDKDASFHMIQRLDEKIQALGLDHPALREILNRQKALADHDRALARAMRGSKAKVVLGHFFYMAPEFLNYEIGEEEIGKRLERIENSRYPLVLRPQGAALHDPFIRAYAPETNLRLFQDAADSSGYLNMISDPEDGILRRMVLVIRCGDELYAPLSVQVLWHYLDKPTLLVRVAEYGIEGVQIGDRFVPTDERGRLLINYLGPEKTFPQYSVSDILAGKFERGAFRDRIVLVGATALGLYDTRNTPVSSSGEYPGLEVHATIIDNMLREDFMHKPQWARIYDSLIIGFLGLLVGMVISRTGALKGFLFAAGVFLSYTLINRFLFVRYGVWLDLVYPLFTIVLLYTCLTLFRYFTEERERRKIRGAFSHYVSREVVNEVLRNPESLKLGGAKKELSVLFSDIRGFTSISETVPPDSLVQLLNEYLTSMTEIVFRYQGTLDKYIGDALMAIYGAPLEQPDHPVQACACALDMVEELEELNRKWSEEGRVPLRIGIGINTGLMMVGNMGSVQRFDYTVVGDAVNLASRLEGANKNYRTDILVSEFTFQRVKDHFECLELDSVRVKGKARPVKIYHLMGRKGFLAWPLEAIQNFREGLDRYKKRRWDEALEHFRKAQEASQDFYAARLYVERCLELKSHPPLPDWDGVFTIDQK